VKDQLNVALPTRTITSRLCGVISLGVVMGEAGLVAFLIKSVDAEVPEQAIQTGRDPISNSWQATKLDVSQLLLSDVDVYFVVGLDHFLPLSKYVVFGAGAHRISPPLRVHLLAKCAQVDPPERAV